MKHLIWEPWRGNGDTAPKDGRRRPCSLLTGGGDLVASGDSWRTNVAPRHHHDPHVVPLNLAE